MSKVYAILELQWTFHACTLTVMSNFYNNVRGWPLIGGQWGQTHRANHPLRPLTFTSFREIREASLCRQRQTEYRPSRSVLQGDLEMEETGRLARAVEQNP
jgi:hypothetical protein